MKIGKIYEGHMPNVAVLLNRAKELDWDLNKKGRVESSNHFDRVYLWCEGEKYGLFIDVDGIFLYCGCCNCGHEFLADIDWVENNYTPIEEWVEECLYDSTCRICRPKGELDEHYKRSVEKLSRLKFETVKL